MRADLHIHTTASDGTWDPAQVVQAVRTAGIELFAVTDHDSVANVAETKKLAENTGLCFITGVELNSTKDGHNYHILGYGIDIENKQLQELCRHNQRLLEQKDDDSVRNLIESGWPLSMEEFKRYSYDPHRGGWKALAYLQDKGLCGDVNDFFRRIFTAENDLGFPDFQVLRKWSRRSVRPAVLPFAPIWPAISTAQACRNTCPVWQMKSWTVLNAIIRGTGRRTAGCWPISAAATNCTFPAAATAMGIL